MVVLRTTLPRAGGLIGLIGSMGSLRLMGEMGALRLMEETIK